MCNAHTGNVVSLQGCSAKRIFNQMSYFTYYALTDLHYNKAATRFAKYFGYKM